MRSIEKISRGKLRNGGSEFSVIRRDALTQRFLEIVTLIYGATMWPFAMSPI